jgi:DNA-binding response OmpR family regulator
MADIVKSRILIADLDPDVSRTLQLYFEADGHQVQTLDAAGLIISTAKSWQPNAILVSTEFTDQDPHQVCQILLEDALTAHIPIVMLLHLDERKARLAALEAGVDDILTKPIDIEELKLRVEAAIRFSTMRMRA